MLLCFAKRREIALCMSRLMELSRDAGSTYDLSLVKVLEVLLTHYDYIELSTYQVQ